MNKYTDKIHTYGRIWMVVALIIFISIPLSISVLLNAWPSFNQFLAGYLPILTLFGPVAIIEIMTYTPMLGTAGTYLGFVTGNLSNLKVPCVINSLENAGVTASTDEGEVISTLAVASSSITTIVVLVIGVFGFSYIMPILDSEVLAPAFANILPALFGGLGVVFIAQNIKIAVLPILFMLVLFLIMPDLPVGILIPVGALVAIINARYLYKKGKV